MERPLAGRSILICEDEPLIALDIQSCFEAAGARVVVVRLLRDALLAVEDDSLTAAILDHALSDGDSSRLCARLKERNIPFVLHSGFGDLDGVCGGEAVHVPKPANPEVLVRTVEGLLRRRPVSN